MSNITIFCCTIIVSKISMAQPHCSVFMRLSYCGVLVSYVLDQVKHNMSWYSIMIVIWCALTGSYSSCVCVYRYAKLQGVSDEEEDDDMLGAESED